MKRFLPGSFCIVPPSLHSLFSKVISPLPLGERVGVRGEKGISDGLQNTFQVAEYLVIPESQHLVPFSPEPFIRHSRGGGNPVFPNSSTPPQTQIPVDGGYLSCWLYRSSYHPIPHDIRKVILRESHRACQGFPNSVIKKPSHPDH
jgi:hypothetical protein